jgi:hypothetical protein
MGSLSGKMPGFMGNTNPNAPGGVAAWFFAVSTAMGNKAAQGRSEIQGNSSVSRRERGYQTGEKNEDGEFQVTWHFNRGGGFLGKLWKSVKSFFDSYDISVSTDVNVSLGVQAGTTWEVGKTSIGVEANAFSVDLWSAHDEIDGEANTEYNWIGKNYWMTVKQSAEVGIGVGSISVEREAQTPEAGGAFFNDKLTVEKGIAVGPVGYSEQNTYPLGGLTIDPAPTPTTTNSFQLGWGGKIWYWFRYQNEHQHYKKKIVIILWENSQLQFKVIRKFF